MVLSITDLALDSDGDLIIDAEGNLIMVTGIEAIVQYLTIALRTQYGTYHFDRSFASQLNDLIGQTKIAQNTIMAKLYVINCLNGIKFVKSINSVEAQYSNVEPNKINLYVNCTVVTDDVLQEIMNAEFTMSLAG